MYLCNTTTIRTNYKKYNKIVLTESEPRELIRGLADDQRHRVYQPLGDGLCWFYRQVPLLAEV